MRPTHSPEQISALLADLRHGNQDAASRLVEAIYPELRRIADHYLRSERGEHTLQPTALVHETYARLFGSQRTDWKNRAHFFAAVATEMRRILVDHARARNAQKRPDKRVAISLAEIMELPTGPDQDLVALDEALQRLGNVDARAARVVELRFFTGLNEREAAEALGVSVSTLKRDWEYARAWLFSELRR
ncbi:MAG: ECF-type sigma factor [Steroidobacteraceae bacterium]